MAERVGYFVRFGKCQYIEHLPGVVAQLATRQSLQDAKQVKNLGQIRFTRLLTSLLVRVFWIGRDEFSGKQITFAPRHAYLAISVAKVIR